MTIFVKLPDEIDFFSVDTLCFLNCSWEGVKKYIESTMVNSIRDGWVKLSKIPCIIRPELFGTYQGAYSFSLIAESSSMPGKCCILSSQADGANSLIANLARKLECQVVCGKFCNNWSSKNAICYLIVVDGSYEKRVVRTMRNDRGRLEYFELGEAMWFENKAHYNNRLFKNRVNNDILTEYFFSIGINVNSEITKELESKVI